MNTILHRRAFLRMATLSAAGLWTVNPVRAWGKVSPNEKLNLGVIGVTGRGGDNLHEVSSENIVALCDVDSEKLAVAAQKHPEAKTHADFRKMLEQKDIDAVVVSTPDHIHAVAVMAAFQAGRHVYCEKPLARTVSECQAVMEAAKRHRRITQLGTQIHAGNNYRRVVELVRSGSIGSIQEVHVWAAAVYGGMDLPKTYPPVPPSLNYDLWLGPVEYRPYSPEWVPFKWRNWWAFGGGSLADFGCHFMDLPFWALGLSHPTKIEVVDGPPAHPESTPPWLIVRYLFPRAKSKTPIPLTWYHGGRKPESLAALLNEDMPSHFNSGVLFVGDKGQLVSDYGSHVLLPESEFKGFKPPPHSIPASIGHHKEWIQAIKKGGQTTCDFSYSGPLSQTALLGNAAYRTGTKLEFDPRTQRVANTRQADPYLQHHYRAGWSL